MSYVAYPTSSIYAVTPQLNWRLGNYAHRPIAPAKGDTQITLLAKYNWRPDRLSYDLYGTQNYWWVFMLRNMNVIRDPIYDLTTGKTIWVPSLDGLNGMLGT